MAILKSGGSEYFIHKSRSPLSPPLTIWKSLSLSQKVQKFTPFSWCSI